MLRVSAGPSLRHLSTCAFRITNLQGQARAITRERSAAHSAMMLSSIFKTMLRRPHSQIAAFRCRRRRRPPPPSSYTYDMTDFLHLQRQDSQRGV